MDAEVQNLAEHCAQEGISFAGIEPLQGGGHIVKVNGVRLPRGWNNRATADILFVAPPGYPAARPDCFWVTPSNFRLDGGITPQATSDSNPIPGDTAPRATTWFSWHLSEWRPGQDNLLSYFKTILTRLNPPR